MTRRVYSRENKRDAAQLVTARGVSVAQAAVAPRTAFLTLGQRLRLVRMR